MHPYRYGLFFGLAASFFSNLLESAFPNLLTASFIMLLYLFTGIRDIFNGKMGLYPSFLSSN